MNNEQKKDYSQYLKEYKERKIVLSNIAHQIALMLIECEYDNNIDCIYDLDLDIEKLISEKYLELK